MIGQDESNRRLAETITGILSLDTVAMEAGRARQDQLTKPSGSLGRLEALSVQLAAHQRQTHTPTTANARPFSMSDG